MKLASQSYAQILAVVDPIMDNLMDAANNQDYENHIRDFTPRLKQMLQQEGFERMTSSMLKHFGPYTERTLVELFRRADSLVAVWKQKCANSDDEFMASLAVVETEDGQYLVDHALII